MSKSWLAGCDFDILDLRDNEWELINGITRGGGDLGKGTV